MKSDLSTPPRENAARSPASVRASDPGLPNARLLLVIEKDPAADAVADWLRSHPQLTVFTAHTATRAMLLAHEEQPEIAVIDLLFRGSAGIALGFEVQRQAPHVEVVFSVPHMGAPEAHAAHHFGITRLVATAELGDWLSRTLGPLTDAARARRRLETAERTLGRLPPPSRVAPAQLPLPVAEHRFREAYLRACMAQASGRREAAKLAGVPYTSLCVMLRKLGIVQPD